MSQQPPPGSWPPPEGVPQHTEPPHTAPLWYGQPRYPAGFPVGPGNPDESDSARWTQPGAESARPRRLAELGAVAALAAVLASAGTFALTRDDIAASSTAQIQTTTPAPSRPVRQAVPSAPNWEVTAAVVSPSVVAISVQSGQGLAEGSGVIFDTKGHIITNHHVVAAGGDGSQLSVTLNDKRTYDATIVGTDPSTDLAVIKLTNPPKDLKAIAFGDANALKVGEPVMAVGNPLGLAGTVTTGIVSALNRPVTTSAPQSGDPSAPQPTGEPVVTNAIQTSAAINPGNSGGALVDGSGRLVGINSAIAQLRSSSSSSESGNIGIGFAIPVNEARSIATQLVTSGKATHPYLGVSPKDAVVPDGAAKRPAALLTSVAGGAPADKAGLRPGDAIIAIDGEPVDGALSLVAQVRERSVGEKVALTILRNGQRSNINATLASRPTTNP